MKGEPGDETSPHTLSFLLPLSLSTTYPGWGGRGASARAAQGGGGGRGSGGGLMIQEQQQHSGALLIRTP